jgi:molybdopterin molybdotransferase
MIVKTFTDNTMLTPSQADKIISKSLPKFASQTISLNNSYGAILDEDVRADRNMPAFDKALMDGIAVDSDAWRKGRRTFTIQGVQSAGNKPLTLKFNAFCFEITTGSVLPKWCDTVVPVEHITIAGKLAEIKNDITITRFQNIQQQGSDKKKGDIVLKKGLRLFAPQMAIAASVGKTSVKIKKRPRVAIIATGDELVSIPTKPNTYQTRLSNSIFIKTALDHTGLFTSEMFHIKDDKVVLKAQIKKIFSQFSMVVLSGGVSKGKFDYVPQVLKELGVKTLLHNVSQKPGKPMWFGKKGNIPVFALPGNPVSTQVCLVRYVISHVRKTLGVKSNFSFVKLGEDVKIKTGFTFFLPVKVNEREAELVATPEFFDKSGNLSRLSETDGFVELKGGYHQFKKGQVVPFYSWT